MLSIFPFFAFLEGGTVEEASFNYTAAAANRNAESALVSRDPVIAHCLYLSPFPYWPRTKDALEEQLRLVSPVGRNLGSELFQGQMRRLGTFEDRLGDMGSEEGQLENSADVSVVEFCGGRNGALVW